MIVVQVLILAGLLLVIPFFAGGMFAVVEKGRGKYLFRWISGQFLLWVGVELIAAGLIARQNEMSKAIVLFWCYIIAVLCYSLGAMIRQRVRGGKRSRSAGCKGKHSVVNIALWGIFVALLLFQLVRIVFGFDVAEMQREAFYIDNPFSLWVMFLADVSGMELLKIEQIVLPLVFLCMSYGIFYLLGVKLFVQKREHCSLFMVLVSVIAIGGGYVFRFCWPGEWLWVRNNAEFIMLGSVLVPYLMLLAVMIMRMTKKKQRTK